VVRAVCLHLLLTCYARSTAAHACKDHPAAPPVPAVLLCRPPTLGRPYSHHGTSLLQHQNKTTSTTEQNYCNTRCKIRKKKLNETKKYYSLQHHNNGTATKTEQKSKCEKSTSEKRLMQQRKITCCNRKPKLLQQQETKHNVRCNIRKRLMQQRKITCCNSK